jgi:multiple sugar transport system substrate-binding protein
VSTFRLVQIFAALTLVVAIVGCGGGGPAGNVSFLVFGDPQELKAFRNVVSAFHAGQKDVRVKLVEASDRDDLIARLSTGFAGGNAPDLFLLNYRFYGQFAARGLLEPIEERLSASDELAEADFYKPPLDAFRWNHTLTCLPQNVSSLVVYYNKALFRKAGVALPRAGWTWRQFLDTASALKDPDKGVYGVGVEPSLIRIAPFVWSYGGELVKPDGSGFALDTPEARDALGRFLLLRRQYGVIPSEEEVESEDDETRFQNGKLGMVLSSRRSTPAFRTITTFDWDVAPLPRHKRAAGILHSDAYCMTKASKEKEAAWTFMEFALGLEGQRIAARTGRTVPSLKSVAQSPAFLDPNAKPASSQVFLDTIPSIRAVPTISTWPEIEDAAGPILEHALYEARETDHNALAADVAAQLDAATRKLFARAEK